uniref:28S ribosomal protein S36, mitochondrial n=1 Tax=Arion vulgaris TaxID=1028688 RepID=A0A0B6ZB13_9EUPU
MHSLLLLRKTMGAAAGRTANIVTNTTVEAIKPHVPLIKFPARGPGPAVKETVNSSAGKQVPSTTASNTAVSNKGSSATSKGSSATALDSSQLPQKYRRKLITKEEIEYIEKGGQV